LRGHLFGQKRYVPIDLIHLYLELRVFQQKHTFDYLIQTFTKLYNAGLDTKFFNFIAKISFWTYLIHYIHANPEKNHLCADSRNDPAQQAKILNNNG
jgi:hypothetical protein